MTAAQHPGTARHAFRVLPCLLLCALLGVAACAAAPPQPSRADRPAGFVAAAAGVQPTLADLWDGRAAFVVDVAVTGLPLGESETIVMDNGEWWSYTHASTQSAGITDRCGAPVAFPGCTVLWRSSDDGVSFALDAPVCLFDCVRCPCRSTVDHIDQQQYPDVVWDGALLRLVYEYRGRAMVRESADGRRWSEPRRVAETGIWRRWLRDCGPGETIGDHPFVPYDYECLAGAPPGIAVVDGTVYIFVGVGQNPGGMGCYRGSVGAEPAFFVPCRHNPLFQGAPTYGPTDVFGAAANPWFDFRTVSSAEILPIDDRFYLLYEGIRGPGPADGGDSQFGLGLARSVTAQIDGPWETFPGNPLLVDLPGNVGLGHADLVVHDGVTLLYTSLDGATRSRLRLVWQP